MALGWVVQRKAFYGGIAAAFVVLLVVFIYVRFFIFPPSCFDNKQDGTETGIDCGGSCSLLCANQAQAPVILWARAFEVTPTTYTAAAYIQNANAQAGAKSVHYLFELFDSNNALVVEQAGVTDLPPIQTIPIVLTGINVGQRSVSRTLFSFTSTPVWNKVPSQELPTLSIGNETLTPDGTSLSATISNNSFINTSNLTVDAVVFNAQNVAVAASKSIISSLPSQSSQSVVFTWPNPQTNVGRAEITLLPSF